SRGERPSRSPVYGAIRPGASLPKLPRVSAGPGVNVDFPNFATLVFDLDGTSARGFIPTDTNLLVDYNASALEHAVLEETFNAEGISTVKGVQLARKMGTEILRITANYAQEGLPNVQTQLDKLRNTTTGRLPDTIINKIAEIVAPTQAGSHAHAVTV